MKSFLNKHIVYDIRPVHEALQLVEKSTIYRISPVDMRCVFCGAVGNTVITYRAINEPDSTRKIGIFSVVDDKLKLLTIDHLLPVSLGGSNHSKNLRILCKRCNTGRGNTVTRAEMDVIIQSLDKHVARGRRRYCRFVRWAQAEHPDVYLQLPNFA